jgi:transcription termination factor Rho
MVADSDNTPVTGVDGAEERGRSGRRRKSRRRRGTRRSHNDAQQAPAVPSVPTEGFLYRREDGKVFLLAPDRHFEPGSQDPLVDPALVARLGWESGVKVQAVLRSGGGQRSTVVGFTEVEGLAPEEYAQRATPFGELVCIDPTDRFRLETDPETVEPRVVELMAPIGKGQRCLIVAPPKAGKTILLQQLAHAIGVNHPEVTIFVLLVDERPEEVTDWKRRVVRGEVFASSSDRSTQNHIEVSEIVLDRARRMVELGQHVVVFMDSLTRMSRAYNNAQKSSGRIMSGGIDARTMVKPRRFFGSARNIENGGSLTIIATCLVDTGSRMDEVIFQEFKGTGNMEIILSHDLFERRIFPCINIAASGTRKEEKLYSKEEVNKLHLLRRALATLSPHEAMSLLISRLKQTKSNADFLKSIQAKE